MEGKLLRLRKQLGTATTIIAAQRDYEQLIVPLFSNGDLVEQTTVKVPDYRLNELDRQLRSMELNGTRSMKRRNVYLSREGVGTLVTDMSPRPDLDLMLLEIKPKWLTQSPSAPKGARRCRTCALRAMKRRNSDTKTPKQGHFCPLDLVSKDRNIVAEALYRLYNETHNSTKPVPRSDPTLNRVIDFVATCPILKRLRELQIALDPNGVLNGNIHDSQLLTAMTLRDCTWFLRIPKAVDGELKARLGDLDQKSPKKVEYWRSIEQQLIDEGWYLCGEKQPFSDPIICALQR